MTTGQRIAELRKEQGLSQEALGELMGVSRQAISKWESDSALPEIEKLIALAQQFKIPVGVLLGVEELKAEDEPEETVVSEDKTAEVLQKYLEAQSADNKGAQRAILVSVIAVVLSLIICIVTVVVLGQKLSELSARVDAAESQAAAAMANGGTVLIPAETQPVLDTSIVTSAALRVQEVNYKTGCATIHLSAVLHNPVDEAVAGSEPAYKLFATAPGGGADNTFEQNFMSFGESGLDANVEVPLRDGLQYFLTTPEGTVAIPDSEYSVTNLAYLDGIDAMIDWEGTSGAKELQSAYRMEFHVPVVAGEEISADQVKVDVIYSCNGEEICRVGAEYAGCTDYSSCYEEEFGAVYTCEQQFNGAEFNVGDEITAGYQITLPGDRSYSGSMDEHFNWSNAEGWVFSVE